MPPVSAEEIERFVIEQLRNQSLAQRNGKESYSLETLLTTVYQRFYISTDAPGMKTCCPFPLRMIPSLNGYAMRQSRIVAKVQCAVATRPIVTVAELEDEICFAEGVANFAQLGFGGSLTSLGIVQQFFKTNQVFLPHRVSSGQFMSFLISDEGARKLLAAGADAADLVHGFTRFIGLRHANDCGIHIQNLPWLLALLRAEVGQTSSQLEKRQKQASSLGSGIARIAELIGTSLWTKLQEGTASANDGEELVLRLHDSAVNLVLPAHLSSSSGSTSVIICSPERANKLLQYAANAERMGKILQPSHASESFLCTRQAAKKQEISNDVIDIDDLDDAEERRTSIQTLDAAVELSFVNRVAYCASDDEVDSLRRCTIVLSNQGADVSMSCSDFAVLNRLHTECGNADIMRSVEIVRRALELRQGLIASHSTHETLASYHRMLLKRTSWFSSSRPSNADNEGEGLDEIPFLEALSTAAELTADQILLPVRRGVTHLLLTVEQLTDDKTWPMTILHGSREHGLHPMDQLTCLSPNRVQCVDTTVLFRHASPQQCCLASITLQGLGIPCQLPFPSTDSHPFVVSVVDCLAKLSDCGPLATSVHKALLNLFHFACDHWADEKSINGRKICDALFSQRWIPVCVGRYSDEKRTILCSPGEVLDPSPKMIRLFEGIGKFAPHGGVMVTEDRSPSLENSAHVKPLSVRFLAALGAQLVPTAALVIDVLLSLRPGVVIPTQQLERMYSFLQSCSIEECSSLLADGCRPVVAIPANREGLPSGIIEIDCMVAPDDCCWCRVSPSDDEQELFHRSLSCFFNPNLREVFTKILNVQETCHLQCWVSSMRWNRCRLNHALLERNLPTLRTLTIKCLEHHLLQNAMTRARFRPSALVLPNEALFPCAGGWRSAHDRVIFDGLALSLTDIYKYVIGPPKPHPSINFFVVGRRIDQPLRQLLTDMGLKEFSAVAVTTLAFEQFDLAASTAMHGKLVESCHHVQGLLKTKFPSFYQQIRDSVQKLLSRMFVVVCEKPFVLHTVRPAGLFSFEKGDQSFHIRKSVVTYFDRSNSVLYLAGAQLAPHVLAEVFAEMFCPLFFPDVFEEVAKLLQFLLRSTDVERQAKLSMVTFSRGAIEAGQEWVVSAPFSARYRQHYPPGTDGLSSPTVRVRPADLLPPGVANDAWGTLEFTQHDIVLRQVGSSGLRGEELMTFKRAREEAESGDSTSSEDEEGSDVLAFHRAEGPHTRMGGRKSRKQRPSRQLLGAPSGGGGGPLFMPKNGRGYDVAAEQFAFEELKRLCGNEAGLEIRWVNAAGEQGTPFDVVAVRTDGPSERVVQYYEVKSTCTKDRKDFELSLRELLFAARYGKQYSIVRVYSASESNLTRMKMEQYPDPVGMWQRGGMTMTGDVKVVII